ncbi:GH3 auxin-responsive promoter family protein [Actinosynnema sp. NPDC091369]
MSSADDRLHQYRARVFAERDNLLSALSDVRAHQQRVLTDMLQFNAGTEFGRAHDFARVRTLDDFRKAVPINDYAALSPWIERMASGAHGVLTADDPAVYFTSSGSTGAHKKVPVTPRFMKTTFFPFYYAAWAPLAHHFPDVLTAPDRVLNLKHDLLAAPPTTASGHAHVGASQVDFGTRFGEPLSAEPGTSAPWATLPVPVAADDHLEKTYLRLRLAVEHDVRCVVGINPAMVAALPHQLAQWWPRILREVRDGTVGGARLRSPNPERAAELSRLADHFGVIRPSLVWPNMRVIFGWTTGVASLYLSRLREEFGPGVALLPAPVAASEGPVGVALDRHRTAGSLVVTASVYEFVDADLDPGPDVPVLDHDELEPGRDYHVVFSHVGGLYRYAVGDVVQVVDRVAGVPRVEYAGRATRSNAVGERLRDGQVVRALAAASTGTGLDVDNAACRVADPGAGPRRYDFAVAARTPWHASEVERFAALLDAGLARRAEGYRSARDRGALGPPRVLTVDTGSFVRDWQDDVARGVRPTQVKDRIFRQDPGLWHRLTGEEVQ